MTYYNNCEIRFYSTLNDFLSKKNKQKTYKLKFLNSPSVKDIIESQNVPHVEVGLILVNSLPVDFNYRVKNNDKISVYPYFKSLDISSLSPIHYNFTEKKFILDVHLGKLAKYLRMLGFDCFYNNKLNDNTIIDISIKENRIILTHDIGILKNSKVKLGYWIRSYNYLEQIKEVLNYFNLHNELKPFTRCLICNNSVIEIKKEDVIDLLQENTKIYFNEFYKCLTCNKIYWKGSHYIKMKESISNL